MSSVCTIIIPIADYHKDISDRAIQSASHQTVECKITCNVDYLAQGAGYMRNEAVKSWVETPFVTFLDADDYIAPDFVEQCLRAYENGTYVYTSWLEDAQLMRPRACNPYGLVHDFENGRGVVGGYHLVTTLFPTDAFKALGGFDETLPGMEDTDFYMRAARLGICGKLLDKPLLNYSGAGQRSKLFKQLPEYGDIVRKIYDRDGGLAAMAGCCGITGGVPAENLTGAQPDDIKAMTLYTPSTQYGRVTGRFYPRPLYQGQIISVDPRDVEKAPELWREVIDPKTLTPDKQKVMEMAGLV